MCFVTGKLLPGNGSVDFDFVKQSAPAPCGPELLPALLESASCQQWVCACAHAGGLQRHVQQLITHAPLADQAALDAQSVRRASWARIGEKNCLDAYDTYNIAGGICGGSRRQLARALVEINSPEVDLRVRGLPCMPHHHDAALRR